MIQANYALRLQGSIKAEAERLAKAEGTTLQPIHQCCGCRKDRGAQDRRFLSRMRRADLPGALALLDRLGRDEPPRSGDELE
jgi:hypothetical protein